MKKMPGNRKMAVDFQELRRSSAASPHKNKKRYDRNAEKRKERKGYW